MTLPANDDHYNWWHTEKCGCSHCEHDACQVCGALVAEYFLDRHQEWHRSFLQPVQSDDLARGGVS